VQGWKFSELSGDSGQRYSFNIWQQRADSRKRVVTRGAVFYSFDNIVPCDSLREFVHSFAPSQNEESADAFLSAILKFDELYSENVGAPFLGKKTLGFTCGTLARYALFSTIYGVKERRELDREWKQEHSSVMGQGAWFRARKLYRGGINCGAFDKWGVTLEPLEDAREINKYDVNSEYAHVAAGMSDFCAWEVCELEQIFNRERGYLYIVIFDSFHARRRNGMPAVMSNPWNGAESSINIEREFAVFADELDELKYFYSFGECSIKHVFRAQCTNKGVFSPFVEKWYKIKQTAKDAGNVGLYVLSKMVLNSALGQLGKRAKFPQVIHEYDQNTRRIELHVLKPAEEDDDGAFSYSHGARVASLGRIHLMKTIRAACGDKNALNSFIYADTDSVEMYGEAPRELVDGRRLGALKHEGTFVQSVFIQKKIYFNVEKFSPLSIDIHASGINARDIVSFLCENYGVENPAELPVTAFAQAFLDGARVKTSISLNVKGGRATFPFWRKISSKPRRRQTLESMGGATVITDKNGEIKEI
jgi:hypothetical protein